MITRRTLTTLALATALPLASTAFAGNSTYADNSNSASNPNWSHQNSQLNHDTLRSTNEASPNAHWNSESKDNLASADSSGIQRVRKEALKSRLTAESIIGKKVVDREGHDVGEVKDIGLSSVLPRDFRASTAQDHEDKGALSQLGQDARDFAQRASRNVNVYISVGGFMGIGDDVVQVPADKLQGDGDKLRIDMSRDEIKRIASNDRSPNDKSNRYSKND